MALSAGSTGDGGARAALEWSGVVVQAVRRWCGAALAWSTGDGVHGRWRGVAAAARVGRRRVKQRWEEKLAARARDIYDKWAP